MEDLVPDVLEKILVSLDVEQLGVCKCVCKSWHSIISDPYFAKLQLNHSCYNDCENIEFRHKRIFISHDSNPTSDCHPVSTRRLIGSSNGLVCFYTADARVLVVNPTTREVKEVERILVPEAKCWGFGYDSSTDDYKVVVGFGKDNESMMRFQVLTLKSNVWRVVGVVNYTWITTMGSVPGTLCNGALHWFMNDQNNEKKVVVSFCLSREEFKEIPQPDDPQFKCADNNNLGIFKGCLCICRDQYRPSMHIKWIMKNYNVTQSWELLPDHVVDRDNALAYCLLTLNDYISYDSPFYAGFKIWAESSEYTRAPIFVRSLVSPHVNGRPMRSLHVHVRSKWMWNFCLVAFAYACRWCLRQLIGGGDGDLQLRSQSMMEELL